MQPTYAELLDLLCEAREANKTAEVIVPVVQAMLEKLVASHDPQSKKLSEREMGEAL